MDNLQWKERKERKKTRHVREEIKNKDTNVLVN